MSFFNPLPSWAVSKTDKKKFTISSCSPDSSCSNSVLLEDLLFHTGEPFSPIFTPSDQRAALSLYNGYMTFTVLVASVPAQTEVIWLQMHYRSLALLSFEMFYEPSPQEYTLEILIL